jgi:PDZ domain
MGDRILKVNDTDVTGATHQEAVMELLRPGDEIKLTVQHDPLPAGFQVRAYKLSRTQTSKRHLLTVTNEVTAEHESTKRTYTEQVLMLPALISSLYKFVVFFF